MNAPVAFKPNWWARAAGLLLAVYVAYAVSRLDFTWARFLTGLDNGARFTTYAIPADSGSGMIGINGAAARLVQLGDLVIVIAYAAMDETEAKRHEPRVVLVDAKNRAA